MIPSLSANVSSTATSGVKGDQDQRTSQNAGGLRGFQNNFAAAGSTLTPSDVNSPGGLMLNWWIVGALGLAVVGAIWWMKRKG